MNITEYIAERTACRKYVFLEKKDKKNLNRMLITCKIKF